MSTNLLKNQGDLIEESLKLLEWPEICSQLSTFSSTKEGRALCLHPVAPTTIKESTNLLSETMEMITLDEILEGGVSFKGIHDLRKIISICTKGGVVSGEELLKISETLRNIRRLRKQLVDQDVRPVLSRNFDSISMLPELQQTIEFCIEDGGRVADRSSEKLFEARCKNKNLTELRTQRINQILRNNVSIIQDNVITYRNSRPVIPLKASASDKISGIIHDTSSSGNTIFIEPQSIVSIGNQISQVKNIISREEQKLLALYSSYIAEKSIPLNNLCDVILKIDLALSRARYGKCLNAVPPIIVEGENSGFYLDEFSHPLLIWQNKYHHGQDVVPVTFNVSSSMRVIAITGPNTGGKTVTLKSVGLAALMSKYGLLIPCKTAPTVPWFSYILADIGDEQSLQQNLSTFSGHISRIIKIIRLVENSPYLSMVLLDEVGSGTDPGEGASIAIALLKKLANIVKLTIATTHLGELKALKYSDSRFENASVGFDSSTLLPKYNLQWGIPGKSNALAIASRLGLDDEIIKNAKQIYSQKGHDNVNEIIQGLEMEKKRQQISSEKAAALLAKTELLHEEILAGWRKQKDSYERYQTHGREELLKGIREGQLEVSSLIKKLRDKNADGEIARNAGQRLRQLETTHKKTHTGKSEKSWVPEIGGKVRIISIDKIASVVDISEDVTMLTVVCGVFRSNIHISDIESVDGQKPNSFKKAPDRFTKLESKSRCDVRTKKNTVDVRGLRVHEAESVVEEKLRKLNGPVWIVHGIGTGKLKRGLREWFKTLPYIQRVSDADKSDGGSGCSIVWIDNV